MADDLTIEHYLDVLDHHLRHRHDRADLLDEVEDHLRTSVERRVQAGIDPARAEADAVSRFGDPAVVADALAAANGSPAVPTTFTKTAGALAFLGAAGWLAFPLLWWISVQLDQTHEWSGTPQLAWVLGAAALLAGMATSVVVGAALNARHGGLGSTGVAALVAGALGLAAAAMVSWFIYGWSALLVLATVLLTAATWSRGLVPRGALVLAVAAWPIALATRTWLESIEYGAVDEFGDRWEANIIGLAVGGVCTAVSLVWVGAWLAREQPVDADARDAVPA